MQVVGRSDLASNLSDQPAETDEALIDLHAFLVSDRIDSNLVETLRACQVNVSNLAQCASAPLVCSLNED